MSRNIRDRAGTPEEQAVDDGAATTGSRTVTLDDVARLAGVSPSTVSRTLRGSSLVADSTAVRVRSAAESLNFSIDRSASSLASGLTRRIAFLNGASLGPWFSGQIIDGMYAPLRTAGYDLVIYRVQTTEERELFFRELPARRNADALVVSSFLLTDGEHQRLRDLDIPVVYINQHREGAASVSIDDVDGARRATRHLLSLGHRRLAFVAHAVDNPDFLWSGMARVDGFLTEVHAALGPEASAPVVEVRSGPHQGDDALVELLELDPRPTGIVAISDELAIALVHSLRRHEIPVPESISVIGFDDNDYAEPLGLTTVRQDVAELGAHAARTALALTVGASPREQEEVLPTRVVARQTTARPAIGDTQKEHHD